MRNLCLIVITSAILSAAPDLEISQTSKTPYERRGLYHATIRGRFVSPSGEAVAGVHLQLNAGRVRSLPLVDVVTDSDGRFAIAEVNSIYPPYLTWFPPEEWLGGSTPVTGESAADIDIGVVRLKPATVIRVAVELAGGSRLEAGEREPSIILRDRSPDGFRVVAESIGPDKVLRGVSFDEGIWEVSLYTKSKSESYRAPFHGQLGRRDQKFTLRLLRDSLTPTSDEEMEGKMEILESTVSVTEVTHEFTLAGHVAGPDGTPIEGAIIGNFDLPIRRPMPQWVRTGPDGEFSLKSRSTNCTKPSVTYGDSDYWNLFFSRPSLRELSCEDWTRASRTIVMPNPSRLSIRVSGLDASEVHADWWTDSFGWQKFSTLQPWVPARWIGERAIRVLAEGYLPMSREMKVSGLRSSKQDSVPPLEFRFDPTLRRTLSVRGGGKPFGGALVDVESIVDLASDQRRFLCSYRVAPDGRLQLLGGESGQLVEIFVYADGFEPRRIIWDPGAPVVVNLTPRNATLALPPSSKAVAVRIRRAESPCAVRTANLSANKPTSFDVAPGTYDVTCFSARGIPTGYQRLTVEAERTTAVDCSIDQRPRLTVHHGGVEWHVSASTSVPRGGATEWTAVIAVPGLPGFLEAGATEISQSQTESVLDLSFAGKWHIEARKENGTLSLWRDIDTKPGTSIALALPENVGTLKGSMRTYGGGLERSEHGFASPRLQLIADNPGGWSVTEYLPRRDSREGESRHHFTLTGVPAGDYHLFQHLIGKPNSWKYQGQTHPFTSPINAWGGVPVHIQAGSITHIKDFSEFAFAALQVRVMDAEGRPVEHATLRIRDRMSESWRQVEENPAQLEQAAHAIPYPAAARVVGGKAILPNIREGWLDLSVESDTGTAFGFTVPVSPARELSLKLPRERVRESQ